MNGALASRFAARHVHAAFDDVMVIPMETFLIFLLFSPTNIITTAVAYFQPE